MVFCFRRYQRFLYKSVLLGCLIVSSLPGVAATVSQEVEIDAAMVKLGSSHETFQNVGALFKVEAEFSGFEPRLTCVGNVCFLEKKTCIGIMNVPYDASQHYRVGFKLNDGRFFYYDISAIKIIVQPGGDCSSPAGIGRLLLKKIGCTLQLDLALEPVGLTRIDCWMLAESGSEEDSITVGFDIKSCPPFIFDGNRKAFPTKFNTIEISREDRKIKNFTLEYSLLNLEGAAGDNVSSQTLLYKEILDGRELSGFVFGCDGRLMGIYSYYLAPQNQTFLNGLLDFVDGFQYFHTSEPSGIWRSYFLMHVELLKIVTDRTVDDSAV